MKYLFLLVLTFYFGSVSAQFDDRIDTTLLRQLGFHTVNVCEVKPINQLNGTDECTAYMRYFFNHAGKLVEKHYLYNNEIGNRFLYRYNDLGQLNETKTLIHPNDSNSVDFRYDAAGNCIELQCYYRGAKTEKWCYTYNELNQKTAEYRVSNSGDTITTYHYTYSNGKPDLEKYYTGKQLRFVYRYKYDQWGNETGKKHVEGDMKLPFPSTRFSGPGKAVKHTYYEGEQLRKHSFKTIEWDGDRIIREELLDSTGKVFHTSQFHYNDNGLIREIVNFGSKSVNNLNEFYEYNQKGLLITKRSTFNGLENQRTEFVYDDMDRCIGMKRFYEGKLQEAKSYNYKGKSLQAESVKNTGTIWGIDTLQRTFEYTDTTCTAIYFISHSPMIPAQLFANNAPRPGPELLWKKPPTQLHPGSQLTDNNFWYKTIGKISKHVSGGDTIVTQKMGIYCWKADESDSQLITTILRTEVRQNGIKQLTDRDSSGRIHLEAMRLENGSYSIKRLNQFTEIIHPTLQKTYVENQLYRPQLLNTSYYNSNGLVDSIVSTGSQEVTGFRYDKENRLIEKKVRYSSNFVSTTLYKYNTDGLLIRETLFSTNGSISNDRHYLYEHKKLKQVTSSMPAPAQTYRFYYEK